MRRNIPTIAPFLILSILGLTAGLWAGLLRLGWVLPALRSNLAFSHGSLMISGFLGTLITLERVAALRRAWMLAAPALTGLGWVLGLAFPGQVLGPALITLGSLGAVAILLIIVRRETQIFTITMAAGALCWLAGNLLWLGGTALNRVVWWWAAYLVLTIAGERLELSRVRQPKPLHYRLFTAAALVFLAGVLVTTARPQTGIFIIGAGLLALAAWLIRFDIARFNLRHPNPLTRYIALCLFSGYLWLGVSGILNLTVGVQAAGPLYDAVLHTLFVGFVLSMIFGHAPIILPALTGIQVSYHRIFMLPLALLHISLALRVAADLSGWHSGRMWGGLINETALILFLILLARQVLLSQKGATHPTAPISGRNHPG